jgi:hypothetical protein
MKNLKIFLKKKTTKNKIQDYQDTTSFDKSKINGVAGISFWIQELQIAADLRVSIYLH